MMMFMMKNLKLGLDKDGPPSNEEIHGTYNNILFIEKDTKSEFVRIGFKHKSPDIAAEWTHLVIKDLNDALRKQDINEAERVLSLISENKLKLRLSQN